MKPLVIDLLRSKGLDTSTAMMVEFDLQYEVTRSLPLRGDRIKTIQRILTESQINHTIEDAMKLEGLL